MYRMKNLIHLLIIASVVLLGSCKGPGKNATENESEKTPGIHKVTVAEVVQANAYTYLSVDEEGDVYWIAVPKIEAFMGETYYFSEAMEMKDFKSKDLDRVFESVLFVQNLSKEPIEATEAMPAHATQIPGAPVLDKKEVHVHAAEGAITLKELFSNKKKYEGQKVTVSGEIVKVNYGIMDKNWFHLQDGTESDGNYDLTITSLEEGVEIGQTHTFEGTLVLDKDFGYGYSYEVLLEEAVIKR